MIKTKYILEVLLLVFLIGLISMDLAPNKNEVTNIELPKTFSFEKSRFGQPRYSFQTLSLANVTLPPVCTSPPADLPSSDKCFSITGSKCCNPQYQSLGFPSEAMCPTSTNCRKHFTSYWCTGVCLPRNTTRFCNQSLWGLIGVCSRECPQLIGTYLPTDDSDFQQFSSTLNNGANQSADSCWIKDDLDTCKPCVVGSDPFCKEPGSDSECKKFCNVLSSPLGYCNSTKCTCDRCRPCTNNDALNISAPTCDNPAASPQECKSICPIGVYDSALCTGSRCVCTSGTPAPRPTAVSITNWTVNGVVSYVNLNTPNTLPLTFNAIVNCPVGAPSGVVLWVDTTAPFAGANGRVFSEIPVRGSDWNRLKGTTYGFTYTLPLDTARVSSKTPTTFRVYLFLTNTSNIVSNSKFRTMDSVDDTYINDARFRGYSNARIDATLQRSPSSTFPDGYVVDACGNSNYTQVDDIRKAYGSIDCSKCPSKCRIEIQNFAIIRIVLLELSVAFTEYVSGTAIIGTFRSLGAGNSRTVNLIETALIFSEVVVIESVVEILYSGGASVNFGKGCSGRFSNHFRCRAPAAVYGSLVVSTASTITFSSRTLIHTSADINLDHTDATVDLTYNYSNPTTTTTFDTNSSNIAANATCVPGTTYTCTNTTTTTVTNSSNIVVSTTTEVGAPANYSANISSCTSSSSSNGSFTSTANNCATCVIASVTTCPTPQTTNTTTDTPSNSSSNSSAPITPGTSEDSTRTSTSVSFTQPLVEMTTIQVVTIAQTTQYLSNGKCRGKGRVKTGRGHVRHYKFTYSLRIFMTVVVDFAFPTRWRSMWPKQTTVQGSQTLCASTFGQTTISIQDKTSLIVETTCALSSVTQETGSRLQVSSTTGTSTSVNVASGGTLAFTQVSGTSVFDILGDLTMDSASVLNVQVTANPISALFLRWVTTSCTLPKGQITITGCTNCQVTAEKEGTNHCLLRVATTGIVVIPSSSPIVITPAPSSTVPSSTPTTKSSSSDNKALLGLIALVAIPIIVIVAILIYFGVKKSSEPYSREVDLEKSDPAFDDGYAGYNGTPTATPIYASTPYATPA